MLQPQIWDLFGLHFVDLFLFLRLFIIAFKWFLPSQLKYCPMLHFYLVWLEIYFGKAKIYWNNPQFQNRFDIIFVTNTKNLHEDGNKISNSVTKSIKLSFSSFLNKIKQESLSSNKVSKNLKVFPIQKHIFPTRLINFFTTCFYFKYLVLNKATLSFLISSYV